MKSKTLTKLALILGVYCAMGDQFVVQPVIGLMIGEMAGMYPITAITAIMTVSSAALAVASLVAGAIGKFVGRKKLLLIGMVLFSLGGVSTMLFQDNIMLMYATRVVEGFGAGLTCTMSTALIAILFEDEKECNWMMGAYAGWGIALAGIFFSIVGGQLGTISWGTTFYLYLGGIVIFFVQLAGIPSDAKIGEMLAKQNSVLSEGAAAEGGKRGPWVTKPVIGVAIIMLVFATAANLYPMNVAPILEEYGLGMSAEAGLAISMTTIGSFVGGLVFAPLFNKIREWTPAVAVVLVAVGSLLVVVWQTGIGITIAAFVYGFGWDIYFAYAMARTANKSTPETVDNSMAIVNFGYYIGIFLASFLMGAVAVIFNSDLIYYDYVFLSIAAVLFAVFFVIRGIVLRKKENA